MTELPWYRVLKDKTIDVIVLTTSLKTKTKEYSAETFEMYQLNGTPSTILVDRKGILRDVSFGQTTNLESKIEKLLNE